MFIKTKKFENNDFQDKEDALAIIDLAEACEMFQQQGTLNRKASGICLNNIGYFQQKNGNFDQAAENYNLAINQAHLRLKEVYKAKKKKIRQNLQNKKQNKPKDTSYSTIRKRALESLNSKDTEWHYYRTVEAHRWYLYSVSLYKHLRYTLGKKNEIEMDPNGQRGGSSLNIEEFNRKIPGKH